MKKITLFLLLSVVIVLSAEAHRYRNSNAQLTITLQTFYDQLSPFGDWIYSPENGFVWRPYFDSPEDFRPYSSGGNWVYTTYGWTWVSDYNWGWATFHYGRWDFDEYLGWTWIPGYEWAPAWVSWGSYDNYWGWAPMGPNSYAQYNSGWNAPDPWWTFVPRNQFCSGNWNNYIYDRPVNVINITYINNVYVDNNNHNGNRNSWYQGPRVSEVERYNRNRVRTMEVVDSQRPENMGVRNERLNVYRPSVDNRRSENRPTEYRNAENARSSVRFDQSNARTNNPGLNRNRESRTETRTSTSTPLQRNENLNRQNRVEPGTMNRLPGAEINGSSRDSRAVRGSVNTVESRKGSVGGETRMDTRTEPKVVPESNSVRTQVEPIQEIPRGEKEVRTISRPQATPIPSRIENLGNRQTQTAPSARGNENINQERGKGMSQPTAIQPSREQKTQNSSPSALNRVENPGRNQPATTDIRNERGNKSNEQPVGKTSVNPSRR